MNFQGLQAKYRRLHNENAAWKLLRAENAPYILAFIADLFSEESEIPYGRARVILDEAIERSRELGLWSTETNANTYLNQWIRNGWLREMDDLLTKTDASETALRFCLGMDERTSGMTASHLRIVQEAVRDFAVAISPNIAERVSLLENKKAEIQREIDALQAGDITELSEAEKKERVREIYQLASVLTGDFRRVEDEIRQLDKTLRIQIIEGENSRGDILLSLMEKEKLLAATDAGSAFESFFQLLCDQDRSTEFREQLRSILNSPIKQHLSPTQQQLLGQLMRELCHESDRVFRVRQRTEEGLRSYIESSAAMENQAVNHLLSKLEKMAVSLRDVGCELKTPTTLRLPVGSITVSSPESMKLKSPDEKIDTSDIQEQTSTNTLSDHVLNYLDTVQIRTIAERALHTLIVFGPMTIAGLVSHNPLCFGLEELVAYLRVAKAVGAAELGNKEEVMVADKNDATLNALIPTFLLSRDLFPEDMDILTV